MTDTHTQTEFAVLYSKFPLRRPVTSKEEGALIIHTEPDAQGASLQTREATPWVTLPLD